MVTLELLRQSLEYNKETGVFTRLRKSGNCRAGSVVGGKGANGYVYVSVGGGKHLAHRMVWLYEYGEFPECDIDHINGDRSDNRISNLRSATRGQNMQNERRARVSNKSSGLLGVSWHELAGKWAAGIKVDGKKKHLGLFEDPLSAHAAYISAKRQLHPFCTI